MNTQLEGLIREAIYAILNRVQKTLDLFYGSDFSIYFKSKQTVLDLKAEKLRLEIALLRQQLPPDMRNVKTGGT